MNDMREQTSNGRTRQRVLKKRKDPCVKIKKPSPKPMLIGQQHLVTSQPGPACWERLNTLLCCCFGCQLHPTRFSNAPNMLDSKSYVYQQCWDGSICTSRKRQYNVRMNISGTNKGNKETKKREEKEQNQAPSCNHDCKSKWIVESPNRRMSEQVCFVCWANASVRVHF